MKRIAYTHRPLEKSPAPKMRKRSAFTASFDSTMDLLDRELGHLGVREAVLQIDLDPADFRIDGSLRKNARRRSPAVALSFQSKHGPLIYPCDTYQRWEDNVRAIALALEALRAVDRYGVTTKGEQYTGWSKLPPPDAAEFTNPLEALDFLRDLVGVTVPPRYTREMVEPVLREAELKTHPDVVGGNGEMFKRVQAARAILTR